LEWVREDVRMDPEKVKIIESFWNKLEEQTEKVLFEHSTEVHAVAKALLERNDLTGRQCIEIIKSAVGEVGTPTPNSENLLKSLVEETIVSRNGKSEDKVKAKRKAKTANPKLTEKVK